MPPLAPDIHVSIRNVWARLQDHPENLCMRELEGILGRSVVIEPDWDKILVELGPVYPDHIWVIDVVSSCVYAWIGDLIELLRDPANNAWAVTLFGKAPQRLQAFVGVVDSEWPWTTWSDQRDGFVINVPKRPIQQPAELSGAFFGGLLACFDSSGSSASASSVTGQNETGQAPTRAKVEFFPRLASLPRPEELFLQPPYHLTVHKSASNFELQGTHSPSLKLIADYLRKCCWATANNRNNAPGIEIKLKKSPFGLGDRLTLSTSSLPGYGHLSHVTAPMIAAFIEGVLGYELVSTDGRVWSFRRDVEFKSSDNY